jgi:hypothetical protein
VVARPEAQERRGAMPEMRQHQLAGRAIVHRQRLARLGVDQLRVDEAVRAQVHAILLLALAPEGHADVADAHRLRDLRVPTLLEPGPERRFPTSGLARHENTLDARVAEIESLRHVRRVRRREHDRLGPEQLD